MVGSGIVWILNILRVFCVVIVVIIEVLNMFCIWKVLRFVWMFVLLLLFDFVIVKICFMLFINMFFLFNGFWGKGSKFV